MRRLGVWQGSDSPDRGQREVRKRVRYRKRLPQTVPRSQQGWAGAKSPRSSRVADILGKSGTRILQALAPGATDPAVRYHRVAGRQGKPRAADPSLQVAGTVSPDLGGNDVDERDRNGVHRRATRRLEA